jgi:putative transposase
MVHPYHVTLRGNHRQNIFFAPVDRQLLDEIIAEVLDRFKARLHAYCYMTNHLHALIQVSEVPLGRLMLRIAGRYARTIQSALHTTGHLFEKRYHPILVDADTYLLELLRYIHLNPVRARMVAKPEDYPWSSHLTYLGKCVQPWIHTDFALSMFHSERAQAVHAYQRFINQQGAQSGASPFVECNSNDRRILGTDDFAGRMLGEAWRPRSRKPLEQIIEEACAKFNVTVAQLCSTSRSQCLVKVRAWITHQAVSTRVCSIAAVARQLARNESSLRHAMKRYFDYP